MNAHTEAIDKMYAEMVERIPRYQRARKVMLAYIEAIESHGGVFTWSPVVDGTSGTLSSAVEERCGKAVVRELKKCVKEIDTHLNGLRKLHDERSEP